MPTLSTQVSTRNLRANQPDAYLVFGYSPEVADKFAYLSKGDEVHPWLADRLIWVSKQYRMIRRPIVVTGREGPAMRDFLLKRRVLNEDILVEDEARVSFENILFSAKKYLGPLHLRNIVAVTSDFCALRKQGLMERLLGPEYRIRVMGLPTHMPPQEAASRSQAEAEILAYNLEVVLAHGVPGDLEGNLAMLAAGYLSFEQYCEEVRGTPVSWQNGVYTRG